MRLHCFGKSEAALEITRGGVALFRETQVVPGGPLVFGENRGSPCGHTGVTLVPILRTKVRPNVQSPHTRARCLSTWTQVPESRSGLWGPHSSLHGSAQKFGLQHPAAQA